MSFTTTIRKKIQNTVLSRRARSTSVRTDCFHCTMSGLFSATTVLSICAALTVFMASCASTDELNADEMDRALEEASKEYSDLAEQLDEMSVIDEELDESTIKRMEERAEILLEELPELPLSLESFRSSFADQIAISQNEIPASFIRPENEDQQRPPDHGFRVQIISTQDIQLANEMQNDFEKWISDVTVPPYAQSYMVFQQPYYRVQVGDFIDREKAMEFTEFVRLRYPDAWVVHSQIRPGRVAK